jgi:CheY-like chemotaxis protein
VATILIQDPYPEIRELVRRVVIRLGHETIDEEEARANPERVDAVVLEPSMLRGLTLTRILKEINPRLPVVINSVYPAGQLGECEVEVEALRPSAHLLKPFTLAQLSSAIELALEGIPV